MKTLLITATLIALPVPTIAADLPCPAIGQLAKSIMTARQVSDNFSGMMEVAKDIQTAKDMVREAFEEPRYSTKGHQDRVIRQFQTKYEIACYDINAKGE